MESIGKQTKNQAMILQMVTVWMKKRRTSCGSMVGNSLMAQVVQFFTIAALLGMGGSSIARAGSRTDQALPLFVQDLRAPKIGFLSLNRGMDLEKTLAAIDTAGFVYNSGILVGAVDQRWILGMSWNSRKDVWWLDGGTTMTAPPGSFGSHVLLGFRDGFVKKVEALTGKVVWETRLDSFTERGFVLSGTKLYVLTAAQILHAIDFQSGQILWVYDGGFPDALTVRGRTKPLVYDGRIYFGVSTGELVCLDAQTGKLEWRHQPEFLDGQFHDLVGDLYVRDQNLIFARFDGLVGAMNLVGPARNMQWKLELPSLTTMAVQGGRIYLGGLNGDIFVKNLVDLAKHGVDSSEKGAEKDVWRYATGLALATFTVTEDLLVAAGVEGRITALSLSTGELLWHDDLASILVTPPLLIDRGLYFLTGLKSLYGYSLYPSIRSAEVLGGRS